MKTIKQDSNKLKLEPTFDRLKVLTKDSISENEKFDRINYYRRESTSDFHEFILLDEIEIDKHLIVLNDTVNPHCLNLTQERVNFPH
jgi:hypothetical protein